MLDDVGVTVKQELEHDWPTGMRVQVITAWAKRFGEIECYDEGYIGVRVQKHGNVEDINILCTISGGFRIFLGDEKPQREQIMRAAKLTPELKCSNCGNVLAIIHEDFIHMHVRELTVDREYVRKQR